MKCTVIGIAGGTASGKTTIARKIYDAALEKGSVAILRMDDYYKAMDHLTLEERRKTNFDHPDSYDIELILKHVNDLKNGKPIEKPIYDFVISNRSKETETINPSNVIILEGILLFAVPILREAFDIKIFVDTEDDIRFIRRLKRDIEKRGRSVESVVNQYLTTVRPMHLTFVEPSKRYADLIIPEGGHNKIAIDIVQTKIFKLLEEIE